MEYWNDEQKIIKSIIPSFQYSNFFALKMTRIIAAAVSLRLNENG